MERRSGLALVVTIMVAVVLLAGACAPAPSPTPAPAPKAAEPAKEAPKAEAPKPAATAAQPAPAPAQDPWGQMTIPKDSPIKVGWSGALSGPMAATNTTLKNSTEMAIAVKPAILGHKVQIQAEDDQCDAAPSVTIAEKFGNDPLIVGVVGHGCSSGTIPASEVYRRYGKVLIAPVSTAAAVTTRGLENMFRTIGSDGLKAPRMAQFLSKDLAVKKIALVHDKSAYGQATAEGIRKAIEPLGVQVVAFEGINPTDQDFTPLLSKLKPLSPDFVYFGGYAQAGSLLMRQMRELGMDAKFGGDEGIMDAEFIPGAGKYAEGAYSTSSGRVAVSPLVEKFLKDYEAKYGKPSPYVAFAYDAATALLMAVEKTAKQQPDGSLVIGKKALADAVRAEKFDGASGTVAFTPTGDNSNIKTDINIVKNGKWEKLAD